MAIKNVFYVDWHPVVEDVLITGSHDRSIKVWNINDDYNNPARNST